ncbi:MAG: rhomboid family intramembrane serine protease [Planctomycetes bacterium]|nr:rhomboid family intramembrane serine protease [Planctomycetota bacterium]
MIPLSDSYKTTIRPVVTIGIIASNVLVFLLTWHDLSGAALHWGAIPVHFTGAEPDPIRFVPRPEAWQWWFPFRALTSAWLHGGLLHIAFNMWFLWVFGDNVEERLGRVRYFGFYLVCALAAVAAQVIANPSSPVPMVGASGAISGVLGAYMRLFPRSMVIGVVPFGFLLVQVRWPATSFIGIWIVLQVVGAVLASTEGGGVAFWAHIGGFVLGWLWAPSVAPKRKRITWTVGRR